MTIGGSKEKSKTKARKETDLTQTDQLVLEQDAIDKIIGDVLGGATGLASIFGGEQATGLFNTTVGAEQAGDLTSKLAGEIAKLTGQQVTTKTGTESTTGSTKGSKVGLEASAKDVASIFGL